MDSSRKKFRIRSILEESASLKNRIAGDSVLVEELEKIADLMTDTLQDGGKILFCGNGGSAADAQHLAAELSGRFVKDREPLHAEAITVNSSSLTAIGNDFGFDDIFYRQICAFGKKNDLLFLLSTSGNSANVLRAIEGAREKRMKVVGFSGETGGKMVGLCDYLIRVPSADTARIQECHITLGHILCGLVEDLIFPG